MKRNSGNDGTQDSPADDPKGIELAYRERIVGMVDRKLKGDAATAILTSIFLQATRSVMYTKETVNDQFMRNKLPANAFAITDRLISTCNTWDSTSVVTSPSPES